ncbi:hypothetical protein DSM112329_00639 [Paraconexibacter sp. AEG42_29]|uniref:Right handed beta helix domain-containing protein n=1 Tax=Paraconexibacter sp. AEG42_29 TaxID=2997339 RepID=A0AAU7AR25_9ACTN
MSARAAAALVVLLGVVTGAAAAPGAAAAATRTWYVEAGAADGGRGTTRAAPLATLAAVEAKSRAGDRIVVLPAVTALDGGLQLKPRQRLIGDGRSVTGGLPADAPAPRLTNSTAVHLEGDAVRLADRTTVRNIRVTGARRGGVYGTDVRKVSVLASDISGHNVGCTRGFLIPPFNVPTTVAGVGIPISAGLHNGWAGIMVDIGSGRSQIAIRGNQVHDADCGDGIDIRVSGDADVRATIAGNDVRELRQGDDLESVLAIGLQTRERSRLVARVEGNRQSGLGNDEDPGLGPAGADSEGVFVNVVGPSSLRATIVRNRYTHTPGRGGFSANGLEFVSMGDGGRGLVEVSDSTFSGTPGDVIEQLALGTGARLRMRLDNVVASGSTGFGGSGFGDTVVIPGNNADCLIAASGGARNVVDLAVRRSRLTDCANNGLTFGSSVANGTGPTQELALHVSDSTIAGNHAGNLRIANAGAVSRLSALVQRTDLSGSGGVGSTPANLTIEDLGDASNATIDLGGGGLGSLGGNCLQGGTFAAAVVGFDVSARGNWWGTPGGPAPGRALAIGGALDTGAPLPAAPARCRP